MLTVYRAIQSHDGAMLIRVQTAKTFHLPHFTHPVSKHPLPWDWVSGFYGRWMVAYAVIYDATGLGAELALKLAAPFAQTILKDRPASGWTLTREEVQRWVIDQASASVRHDLNM